MPKKPICNFSAIGQPYVIYSVSLPMFIVEEMNRTSYTVSEYIKKSIVSSLKREGRDLCHECDYGFHEVHGM